MTIKMWQASIAASLFLFGAPSLHAQDFLKQLEAKLFQKQKEGNGNQEPADKTADKPNSKDPTAESKQAPFELPSVLEPEGFNAPSLLKPPTDDTSMELPAPKLELKAPSVKKPAKPGPSTAPAENPTTTANRPAPAPSPFPKTTFPKSTAKTAPSSAPVGGGGFLGLEVESIPGGGFGLTVVKVAANSPAWRAGFLNGDKIVGVNGQAVSSVDAFGEQLARYAPGTPVKFLVDRRASGRQATLVAVLQDRGVAGQIHGAVPGTTSPLDADIALGASRPGPAYLGINVSNMSEAYRRQFSIPAYRGASVTEVDPNSPAHAAGIRPGDCIVEIEGAPVQTADIVFDTITKSKPGQVISISFYRGRILNSATIQLVAAGGDARPNAPIGPEMLTPEYVAGLQNELERVHGELSETQARLEQLEARLQQIESKR